MYVKYYTELGIGTLKPASRGTSFGALANRFRFNCHAGKRMN